MSLFELVCTYCFFCFYSFVDWLGLSTCAYWCVFISVCRFFHHFLIQLAGLSFLPSWCLSVFLCAPLASFSMFRITRVHMCPFVSINVLPLILASCFVASFVVRCVCCVFCVPIFLPYQGSWSHNTHKVNRVVGLVGLVG